MKNIDYIQNCTEEELSNLLTSMTINIIELMTGRYIDQQIIDFENRQISKWLESEMVKGEYLN